MEFEVDKCAKIALKKNKSLHPQHLHQQRSKRKLMMKNLVGSRDCGK
jgi:hypothetical protein